MEDIYSPICLYVHKISLEAYTRKLVVKQEMGGPRAEQPEFAPCGQIHPNSRGERGAGPSTDERQRPCISHCRGQGDLPDHACPERLLGGQKGSDVNYA